MLIRRGFGDQEYSCLKELHAALASNESYSGQKEAGDGGQELHPRKASPEASSLRDLDPYELERRTDRYEFNFSSSSVDLGIGIRIFHTDEFAKVFSQAPRLSLGVVSYNQVRHGAGTRSTSRRSKLSLRLEGYTQARPLLFVLQLA